EKSVQAGQGNVRGEVAAGGNDKIWPTSGGFQEARCPGPHLVRTRLHKDAGGVEVTAKDNFRTHLLERLCDVHRGAKMEDLQPGLEDGWQVHQFRGAIMEDKREPFIAEPLGNLPDVGRRKSRHGARRKKS